MNTITAKPLQGRRKSALPGQPAKLQGEVCRGARIQEEFANDPGNRKEELGGCSWCRSHSTT